MVGYARLSWFVNLMVEDGCGELWIEGNIKCADT